MKFFSKKKALRQQNNETENNKSNLSRLDSSELASNTAPTPKINHKKRITKVVKCIFNVAVTAGLASMITRIIYVNNKSYFKNSDSISLVANELGIDMNILQKEEYGDQIFRLKPNDNGKINVFIDSSVPAQTSQIIHEALDYYNDIFDKVNDRFNFVVSNQIDYITDSIIQKSTIKFDYKVIDDTAYGVNTQYRKLLADLPVKFLADNKNDGKYCIKSHISLNKTYFDQLDSQRQEYTIRHEILHSLGFADVYDKGNTMLDTMMHTNNMYVINELSPNDMRRIYAAYCEDYMNNDKTINYEKLGEIKKELNTYETKYYDHLANILKKSFNGECKSFSNSELKNFSANYGLLDVYVNSDGNYEYTYNKNATDISKRLSGSGTIVKGVDYALLPNLNYRKGNDYYVIFKTSKGLNIYDFYLSWSKESNKIYNGTLRYNSFVTDYSQQNLDAEEDTLQMEF